MVKIFLLGVIVCAILLSLVSASMTISEEGISDNVIDLDPPTTITTVSNLTWNQTLADELYASIIWGYNQTTATYNLYGQWWYNMTSAGSTDTQKTTNGYFLYNDTTIIFYNGTQLNDTIDSRTATTIYLPLNISVESGTLDAGNVSSLFVPNDADALNVSEGAGANPLIVVINYTGVENFNSMLLRLWYIGGSGHEIEVGLWDYPDDDWEEEYGAITDMDGYAYSNFNVYDADDHISGGNVSLRLRHVQNGITSHDLSIDYAVLVSGFSAITVSSHDALTGRDNLENHPQYFDTDGTRNVTTITVNENITVDDRVCFTPDCSSYIYHNGTGLVIQG